MSQSWRKGLFGARHQLAGPWKALVFAMYANGCLELAPAEGSKSAAQEKKDKSFLGLLARGRVARQPHCGQENRAEGGG